MCSFQLNGVWLFDEFLGTVENICLFVANNREIFCVYKILKNTIYFRKDGVNK